MTVSYQVYKFCAEESKRKPLELFGGVISFQRYSCAVESLSQNIRQYQLIFYIYFELKSR